ncbi:MAG: hypothetical protein K0U47_06720 [Epsilonproteobacteria bacterium]|nr:hypothetical protein [Campylobacterota bacterium]
MSLLKKTTTALAMASSLAISAQAEVEQPLITMVSEKEATGEVKKVYDEVKGAFGMVPNALKHQSVSPEILKNSWEYVKMAYANENFSQKMIAMMRMLVGSQKDCHYCVGVNEGMLINQYKLTPDEVSAIKKDPTTAKLEAKDKAMLLFIVKATADAQSVKKSDIEGLKKLGWSEKDIFEGVKMGANIVAFTITLDTFKVPLDM